MLWESRGCIQVALTGAKEAGTWELVCVCPHAECWEGNPEEPALQPPAKKKTPKNQSPTSPHGIREYTHEKSPLSPTLCLFPPAAGGKVGGRSYVRRHGTSFCFSPPQNSDKSRQTHAQLSQLLTRSAREGHGAELPRRPGAELQRDVANKQQRFAAVCSGEVSTQRWHDPGHQRQHSLCVLFIAKYEHPWQGCVHSTCDTVGLKSLRDPNAPESWPQGGSSQLPKQKNGKWL